VTPTDLSLRSELKITLALIERDLAVLWKEIATVAVRIALQPTLFAFVFVYVFPRIGQRISASHGSADFVAVLLPGLMASTLIFQGVTAVAAPLMAEFESIEDRVMAPVPVEVVGVAKVISASIQAFFAAWLVVPAVWIASGGQAQISWKHPLHLLIIVPLCALVSSALGLLLGTVISHRRVTYAVALLQMTLTMLGCVYFLWTDLHAIPWLQLLTLVNPVVYMSEGLRAAVSPGLPHMPLLAIYGLLVTALGVMLWVGLTKFKARVLT